MTRLKRTLMLATAAVVTAVIGVASPAHAVTEYFYKNKQDTSKCIGVNSANNIASIWNCNSSSQDQRWHKGATCTSDAYCSQVNGNGKCLSVSGGSSNIGAYLTARTCAGAWDQLWKLDGNSALVNSGGWVAAVKDGVTNNGQALVQWNWQAHADQKWTKPTL